MIWEPQMRTMVMEYKHHGSHLGMHDSGHLHSCGIGLFILLDFEKL